MNDERIEARLRGWLATEADSIAMPDTLREAAAVARARRAPRGWSAGWPLSVPRQLLAGVGGLLVVVTGASLVLSGLLPIGRADCSRVSVDAVRAAAEAVDGYRYTLVGSELQARPVPAQGDGEIAYVTSTFELAGSYRAPDAWSIEVIGYDDPDGGVPPSVGFALIMEQFDAYVFVDGRGWARPIGRDRFIRTEDGDPPLEGVGRNRILDLLAGEPFRFDPTGNPSYERSLSWSVVPEASGCRLASTLAGGPQLPGTTWELDLLVDPETMLPTTAHYRIASPEGPSEDDGLPPSAVDIRYDLTFQYGDAPEITPPGDAAR